jgi:hypothetical protein
VCLCRISRQGLVDRWCFDRYLAMGHRRSLVFSRSVKSRVFCLIDFCLIWFYVGLASYCPISYRETRACDFSCRTHHCVTLAIYFPNTET